MEAKLEKLIKEQKRVTISLTLLEKNLKKLMGGNVDPLFYKKLADALLTLEKKGIVEPFKSAKLYSRDTRIKDKYRKKKMSLDDEEELKQELLTSFHQQISVTHYLKHLEDFQAVREYVEVISGYLRQNNKSRVPLSVNERSYKLFGDEKFLDSQEGRGLLTNLKLSFDDLYCYETFEPFFHIGTAQNENENILIVENLDTFFNMKKLFLENVCSWGGIEFSMIIYGEGNKITKSFYYLDELHIPINVNNYYFGDFDREGISIYYRTRNLNGRPVKIMKVFYEKMFERRKNKTTAKSQTLNKSAIRHFFETYEFCDEIKMKDYLISGKYVPQEAIDIETLRRMADGAEQAF